MCGCMYEKKRHLIMQVALIKTNLITLFFYKQSINVPIFQDKITIMLKIKK